MTMKHDGVFGSARIYRNVERHSADDLVMVVYIISN